MSEVCLAPFSASSHDSTLPVRILTLDDLKAGAPLRRAIDEHFNSTVRFRPALAEWVDSIDGAHVFGGEFGKELVALYLPSTSVKCPVYRRLKAVAGQASARYRRGQHVDAQEALTAALESLWADGLEVPADIAARAAQGRARA